MKLTYQSKWLHHSGGTVCEPTDIPVNKRHLDMLTAHMTLTDKPFMGSVTAPERAVDSVRMCEILFGADFVADNVVMTSLVNINSPLTFDATMMGALEVYAAAGQASIVSPFIVGGAMAPVSVAGTLTQVLAEVLAGVAYSQLVRPGAPAIFGAFVTSIDMNSGAPTFGTPEASKILYGAAMAAALLVLMPVGFAQAARVFSDPMLILAGIGVGLCSSVIPYVCDQLAMARLPRASFALMLSLLPAMATLIAALVLAQIPSVRDLIGVALVMAGVAIHEPGRR
ncbi:MAG: hypothetical protein Tsb0010_02640 [Parvularculaceae bacterium]